MRPFLIAVVIAVLLVMPALAAAVPCPHPARSQSAKLAFVKTHPCPVTGKRSTRCAGYVIDHVKPLACCGADAPANMQWQTVAAGKKKDRIELKQCGG